MSIARRRRLKATVTEARLLVEVGAVLRPRADAVLAVPLAAAEMLRSAGAPPTRYGIVAGLLERSSCPHSTKRSLAISRVAFIAALSYAVCNKASAEPPVAAGGVLQQVPDAPALESRTPTLPVRPEAVPAIPEDSGPKFTVNSVRITGVTHFEAAALLAVTGFSPGSVMGLSGLRALAAKITQYYGEHGYIVAQAYLPPQEIRNGAVEIAVIEGSYGKIGVANSTNISNTRLVEMLDGLNSGDPVVVGPLERRLLIMSDRPGIDVASTLAPGTEVGTSDLLVRVKPLARLDGSVEADNAGNPYTGRYRTGGTVNLNEPFGIGDLLSARFLASTTGGMKYGRIFYETAVGDATAGVAYTYFDYHLGKQFAPLDASGSEQIASVYGSYPVIRSYNNNLNVFGDFDYRTLGDRVGLYDTMTDKQDFVVSAGVSGTYRDNILSGGFNAYSLTGTFGDLDIQTRLARTTDAISARTNGSYAKFSYDLSRLQHVVGPLSLFGEIRGQFASKNLDVSEKMELGGAYQVRAYPEGEAYGDEGYVATLEARLLLPKWPQRLPGNTQLISFVDTGSVTFNKHAFASGPKSATRSDAGVGLIWANANNFSASIIYAHELGNHRATSYTPYGDEILFRLVKYY